VRFIHIAFLKIKNHLPKNNFPKKKVKQITQFKETQIIKTLWLLLLR
jgi:hypothetical protein